MCKDGGICRGRLGHHMVLYDIIIAVYGDGVPGGEVNWESCRGCLFVSSKRHS